MRDHVFSREQGDEVFRAAGLADSDVLQLPEIDIEIPIADIYEGFVFPDEGA